MPKAGGKLLLLLGTLLGRKIPRLRRPTFRRSGMQEKASTRSARN